MDAQASTGCSPGVVRPTTPLQTLHQQHKCKARAVIAKALCCHSADGKLLAALAGGAAAAERQLLAWHWGAARVVAAVACDPTARALSAMPEPSAGGAAVWAVRGAQELRLWQLELPQGWRSRGVLARVRCHAEGLRCTCSTPAAARVREDTGALKVPARSPGRLSAARSPGCHGGLLPAAAAHLLIAWCPDGAS